MYRAIEPETWAKLVNRVSGANFGNIYCGNRILGYRNVKLPKGHTWKSYCKLLLATLPLELSDHYKKKFKRFILWWYRKGSPVDNENLKILPPEAVITGRKSPYMETIVRYKKIPDFWTTALSKKISSHVASHVRMHFEKRPPLFQFELFSDKITAITNEKFNGKI